MADIARIQTELRRERDEMIRRVRAPVYIMIKGDEADLAVLSRMKEHTIWLANDAQARLVHIDKALERIEQGTYGACARCGTTIPEERLTTMPTTLYCVRCQSQLERRHT